MECLTGKQLAQVLQVSEISLWRMRKRGMPYIFVGCRSVRYRLADVMAWFGAIEHEKMTKKGS